jgi:hypothetical protein
VEFLLGDVVVAGTHAEAVVIFQFAIEVGKSLNLDLVRMKLTLWRFAQALWNLVVRAQHAEYSLRSSLTRFQVPALVTVPKSEEEEAKKQA